MRVIDTTIPEVKIIEPQVYKDDRGYFYESFSDEWFRKNVCDTAFVQDNQSCSNRGVVRGLHFQKPPYAQSKLVRCISGQILDFAVDIRKESPTYGKYVAVWLTQTNHRQLFIPRGFAHGFMAFGYGNIVQYKVDNPYNKESEGSIKWDDPDLGIIKEIPEYWFNEGKILLSEKDAMAPFLKDVVSGFEYNKDLYK